MKIFYRVSSAAFLFLAICAAYIPFLNLRVLRMAGDEKVYVAQAIEMARGGRWFVQTLADEPNYFKPPLHYVLVHLGLAAFGDHLIAGTWMNLLFALVAAFSMYWVAKQAWDERSAVVLGLAVGLNIGMFSHALASQMEVEISAFYVMAMAALWYSSVRRHERGPASTIFEMFWRDLPFWAVAGAAGWVKSPVYSVLVGISGLLYWSLTRELREKILSIGSWLALLAGIVVSLLIYAPVIVADFHNFFNIFIVRENFGKPSNNRSWTYVTIPLLYFAMPWSFIPVFGFVRAARGAFSNGLRAWLSEYPEYERRLLKLSVAIILPSLLMWMTWSYKGQNYNLPTLCGFFLFGWTVFHRNVPRMAFQLAGVFGILTGAFALSVIFRFWPLPSWWGLGWVALFLVSTILFCVAFLLSKDMRNIAAGAVCLFIAFGAFAVPSGKREIRDLRRFMKEHPGQTYYYYNLEQSIWSEWGLMELAVHQTIYGLHRKEQLPQVLQPGHVILIPKAEALDFIKKAWSTMGNGTKPVIVTWMRWLTKGKTAEGESRWKVAWTSRDLSFLEREFYIFWIPPTPASP